MTGRQKMRFAQRGVLAGAAMATVAAGTASAAVYTDSRGIAGTFGWNDDTNNGNTPYAGENAPSATNGNWQIGNPPAATGSFIFPNAVGDVANFTNGTGSAQTFNLDQNITVGAVNFGHGSNPTGPLIIAQGPGNGGNNVLTMANTTGGSTITHIAFTAGTPPVSVSAPMTVSAPIAIGGNGTLTLSSTATAAGTTTFSGNITSALTGGTSTLVAGVNSATAPSITITGLVNDGTAGSTLGVMLSTATSNLTLSASNGYSGGTSVTGGALAATTDGALGTGNVTLTGGTLTESGGTLNNYVADTATLSLVTGSSDVLNYTGTDIINSLIIDGVAEAPGIYGSTSSGALNTSGVFGGSGTITVLSLAAVPEPASIGLLAFAGLGVLARRRKA